MDEAVRECTICRSSSKFLGVNFGVYTCKACQMFFRRVISQIVVLQPCRPNGPCAPKCKMCRFQKCIQSGMLYLPTTICLGPENRDMISALLYNVKQFEADRVYKLENCYIPGDPTALEIAQSGKLNFQRRPDALLMDSMEWGYISALAAIDYMQKCPCIHSLAIEDQAVVFKKCLLPISLLADGMRAVRAGRDFICFPDGTEIVQMHHEAISPQFDELVRSRVAGKANELRLTIEEALLLSLIIMTSPAIPGLSLSAQTSFKLSQKSYSPALLNYCFLNYKEGATRFVELLDMIKTLNATGNDLGQHYFLRAINRDPALVKRLFL